MLKTRLVLWSGKALQYAARLRGSGGSAAPGRLAEKLDPRFLTRVLDDLPDGVVIVTGTNGKTTTTKLITELLESQGKRVLTNKTGSNFTRGVVSTILNEASWWNLPEKDIAVLELDEAHGKIFAEQIKPDYAVALNVLRDQLDRFGELDNTAKLIGSILRSVKKTCVVNGNEPKLVDIAKTLECEVDFYAVSEKLRPLFPTDVEFLSIDKDLDKSENLHRAVELEKIDGQTGSYFIDGKSYQTKLTVKGNYNFQNVAAILALVMKIMPEVGIETWMKCLESIQPAFGRGEIVRANGQELEIVLVKNPSGFQHALQSYEHDGAAMIAINDNFPDGRDISWLWDVDFTSLKKSGVAVTSGSRAYDMALRLHYDEVKVVEICEDKAKALKLLLRAPSKKPKKIYCNYTAMLEFRKILHGFAELEKIL